MSESPHTDATSAQNYQVLARKYRPTTFEDMIGQEGMVTTLTNAFKAGRVAHAFMLTGVRGIGKTTTARLLARALNYETETIKAPSVTLSEPGLHCERIMASMHMDVLEMDAASRTGVDNMREMLDGVRYAPVEARYKVYIIDEVHMLSTGAFNALLKTLEEPPDHAKFIFATTEIRKVPITVLSRCQRYDLRRVEAQALQSHLSKICQQESVNVSEDGLALIARAAEGSVRDSLSLLDQAIVQAGLDGSEVSADQVQSMLGLADRVRVLDLFEKAATGDAPASLTEIRAQYDDGAAPEIVMRDLLDICHDVSRAKTLGSASSLDVAPDQMPRLQALSERLSLGQLTRIWQMLLKAHNDVRLAPVPLAAAEMALLQIAVASELPPPELAAQLIAELKAGHISAPPTASASTPTSGVDAVSASAAPLASTQESEPAPPSVPTQSAPSPSPASVEMSTSSPPTPSVAMSQSASLQSHSQTQPVPEPQLEVRETARAEIAHINSLDDLVAALPKSEILLASDIRRYARPIQFRPGSIRFEPAEGAPVSLTGKIVSALQTLTGDLWIVSPETQGGGETINERVKREKAERDARERAHPAFSHSLLAGAKLIEIMDTQLTSETESPAQVDNIITGDFGQDED